MKKKYIIALEDRNVWTCGLPAKTLLLSDVSIFGTDLASVNTGIELTPYTEPDLEQVRKEAYEKGYDDATEEIGSDEQAIAEKAYQRGLSDAWECVRKISHMDSKTRDEIFDRVLTSNIVDENTASEAIEKIRQYEQPVTAEGVMRQYLDTFCKGRNCTDCPLHTTDFTCGRGYHFLTAEPVSDEEVRRAYAKVLQKVK